MYSWAILRKPTKEFMTIHKKYMILKIAWILMCKEKKNVEYNASTYLALLSEVNVMQSAFVLSSVWEGKEKKNLWESQFEIHAFMSENFLL